MQFAAMPAGQLVPTYQDCCNQQQIFNRRPQGGLYKLSLELI